MRRVSTARVRSSSRMAIIIFAAGAMCRTTGRPRPPRFSPTCGHAARTAIFAPHATLAICTRVRELLDRDPSLANRVSEYVTYYPGSGAPLRNAAAAGHLEIVKLLLAHGADPNLREEGIAPHGHALYSAVDNGHHRNRQAAAGTWRLPQP